MTLKIVQNPQPLPPSREALWRRRLAGETMRLAAAKRRKRRHGTRNPEDWRAVIGLGLLKVMGLFGRGIRNANTPVLRELKFAFEALPAAFDGFRILHLSDFHFSDKAGFMDAVCRLLAGREVDLCVLTGDFPFNTYAPCDRVYGDLERILAKVCTRHGVLAVLGNNDTSALLPGFRALGIRILVNEHWDLERDGEHLWFAGMDDSHEYSCASVPGALEGIPARAFTILLSHTPELVEEAAARGVDLYLCGHTHGGQVRLPGLGALFLNARCARAYTSGMWRCGDLQGFTTTGVGTAALPVRFRCPPEAAILELRRAPRGAVC